jgi:hypothetical protein
MSSITCPFCGEVMDSPLRFCVGCGRAITQEDLKRSGLKLAQGKRGEGNRPDIAKRDYSAQRKVRSFMYTTSAVLALLIGYYVTMKYVLHEHIPGNLDVKIEQLVGGQPVTGSGEDTPASLQTPAADEQKASTKP